MADTGEAALITVLYTLVTDLLKWLGECPEDDVDRAALAAVRDGVTWLSSGSRLSNAAGWGS